MPSVFVNGEEHSLPGRPGGMLLGWLRGSLGLTGPKFGCGEGVCGACTVLVGGTPRLSCQLSLAEVAGRQVTTIEGLATDGTLHPAQQALLEERASQCGYCSPAMALRIAALIESDRRPEEGDLRAALEGSLCRCGCYSRLRKAALRAFELASEPAAWRAAPSTDRPELSPLKRPKRPFDLTPEDERDYAEVLGPGLVCSAAYDRMEGPVPSGGVFVHVSPAGYVRAFTGKVDVGQDNETAFRLLVAEELGVEPEQVSVIQGDTDLCPYDMGTFGSRSMPDAGQALRRAAAGAREALLRIGGSDLLGESLHQVVLEAEPALVEPTKRRLVGRTGHEPSCLDAVTGRRRFVSDLALDNMGHGAVLRPLVPGSLLKGVESAEARRLGVVVVEEDDFVGVVADDPATAHRAVGLIEATWEEPSPITTDLATYLRENPVVTEGWQRGFDESNGDVAGALASAATSLQASYSTAYLAHVPLETRAALALWEDGRLTVWTGTQVPFGVRSHLAAALEMDEADVRVVVPPTGGAFGGKHGGDVALEAARLARAAGRGVKLHWTRREELLFGTARPMAVIDVTAGLDASGEIAAWDFLDVNAGSPGIVPPYRTRTRRLAYQPANSPIRQGSYRGLAATANNFARESVIDELAHASGADPLQFRLGLLEDTRLATVLRKAADRFSWGRTGSPRKGAGGAMAQKGQGLAVGLEKDGRVATCAEVEVDPGGSVSVTRILTAYDCGAVVNRDTVINQIEGATMMALSGALVEALPLRDGRLAEATLGAYPLARFSDCPEIEVVLLDQPELASAGAGETPMIAVAPALANAIFAATGRRLRHLPLTPGRRLPDAERSP
jgi:nicotinate dehydrogenase subunit B